MVGGPEVGSREKTDFCIGAAAYPEHANEAERYQFFIEKAHAGAEYGITDILFDPESYARFLDGLSKRGCRIPILPGTRILKSRKQAERMIAKFGTKVPKALLEKLPEKDDPELGQELFLKLTEKLRAYGAPGIHVFVIVDLEGSTRAIQAISKQKQR